MSGATTLDTVVWGLNFAAVVADRYGPWERVGAWWDWFMVLISVTGLVFSLTGQEWAAAGFCVATLALLGWDWWNRKGRKAAKFIGDKSRAVLAAVVERAREAGSPVPQGATG